MESTQRPKFVGTHMVIKTNDGMAVQQEDKIHTLNYTASEIYELCDGNYSIDDIQRVMKTRYPDDEGLEAIVSGFLDQLLESGLIEMSA